MFGFHDWGREVGDYPVQEKDTSALETEEELP